MSEVKSISVVWPLSDPQVSQRFASVPEIDNDTHDSAASSQTTDADSVEHTQDDDVRGDADESREQIANKAKVALEFLPKELIQRIMGKKRKWAALASSPTSVSPISGSAPASGKTDSGIARARVLSRDVSGDDYLGRPTKKPALTLSAFCRPEVAVRLLTGVRAHAQIEVDYDFRTEWCRTGRVLGHGATSTVRLAVRKSDGMRVAVKCIPKHEILRRGTGGTRHRALDEFRLLGQISHPNIVKMYDVYETSSDLFLVMELCGGGDLYGRVSEAGRYDESRARVVVKRILQALRYLHDELDVVHRDVKPENILLVDDAGDGTKVKLTDFGLAKRMMRSEEEASDADESKDVRKNNRSRTYSRVGSDYYAAPEVHTGGGYGTAVDLFSLGVCAYILLCGRPPPSVCGRMFLDKRDFPKEISAEATSLVRSFLNHDPDERPTAAEALKHPWFDHADITKLDGDDAHSDADGVPELRKDAGGIKKHNLLHGNSPFRQERASLPVLLTVPCEPLMRKESARRADIPSATEKFALSLRKQLRACEQRMPVRPSSSAAISTPRLVVQMPGKIDAMQDEFLESDGGSSSSTCAQSSRTPLADTQQRPLPRVTPR